MLKTQIVALSLALVLLQALSLECWRYLASLLRFSFYCAVAVAPELWMSVPKLIPTLSMVQEPLAQHTVCLAQPPQATFRMVMVCLGTWRQRGV